MNRKRMQSWRPQLEALEDRWCPACDVSLIGSTLLIIGDSADNYIAFVNVGSGIVHVEADAVTRDYAETIDRVIVRTGAGNDSVFVNDNDFDFVGGISRHWLIDLGTGDDAAAAHLFGLLDAPASITVFGGAGNDNVFVGPVGTIQSTFLVTLVGGDGNDAITHTSSGFVLGTMVVAILGGSGDDNLLDFYDLFSVDGMFVGVVDGGNGTDFLGSGLGTVIEFDPSLPPLVFGFDVAANAHANYAMLGGNGNDSLFGSCIGRMNGQLNVLFDGGDGNDEVFAGLNIHVESAGQFDALLRGGNGDDLMFAAVSFYETEVVEVFPGVFLEALTAVSETPAPLSHRSIVANGGNGLDTCLHTDWVTLLNIEDDQHL
jgi:hypothetical protein